MSIEEVLFLAQLCPIAEPKRTRPGGLEPPTFGFEVRNDKNITTEETKACESAKEPLTSKLTPESQKQGKLDTSELSPDLADLVTAWPGLPEHIKQTIRTLITITTKKSQ